jgi:FKBP-type peptidyl-prolyl cis-trans isomerase
VLALFLALNSCDPDRNKYTGYKKLKNGTYYKLIEIGEDDNKAKIGDFITADIRYSTLNDSVFFEGRRKIEVDTPAYKGSIENCFLTLSNEERAIFIISADSFFMHTLQADLPGFIKPGSDFKIDLKIIEIQTSQDYNKEKEAFLSWIQDFGEYEKVVLKQYLDSSKINVKPTESGLYHIIAKPGNGKSVAVGDTIILNYEGKFLNGKFFDSTIKRNEPFGFVYGQEWQVIKGLEEAIGLMTEGEKAIIIVPSELAFGTTGSSTGIIPPFTSIIFEVELVQVIKVPPTTVVKTSE